MLLSMWQGTTQHTGKHNVPSSFSVDASSSLISGNLAYPFKNYHLLKHVWGNPHHCLTILLLTKQLQEGQRTCCQTTESKRVFTALFRLWTDVHILQTPYTLQQSIRILGRKCRPIAEAVFCSQKNCAVSKAAVVQEILEYLKYCWECQQSRLWLCKSCPVLGTSISMTPYNKASGTATRGRELSENKTSA